MVKRNIQVINRDAIRRYRMKSSKEELRLHCVHNNRRSPMLRGTLEWETATRRRYAFSTIFEHDDNAGTPYNEAIVQCLLIPAHAPERRNRQHGAGFRVRAAAMKWHGSMNGTRCCVGSCGCDPRRRGRCRGKWAARRRVYIAGEDFLIKCPGESDRRKLPDCAIRFES